MAMLIGLITNLLNIGVMVLVAKKIRYAPITAVVVQALWLAYIAVLGPSAYPMLLTVVPVTVIWSLAIPKWLRDK